MLSQAGLDLRADEVTDNELSRTANRTTLLEPLALGDVLELNASAWASQRMQAGAFSVEAGLRYDQFRYQYQDALTVPYDPQSAAKGLLSPKLKLSWQAAPQLRIYLHAGTGFHSNDTRVILADRSREILPRAYGADFGLVAKPLPGMLLQAAVWTLRLDQEFVYVGDAAVVEPSGRTQRMGADVSVRYQLARWLFADADLNYTAAQAVGEAEGEDYIPLAPRWSSIGGLSFRWQESWNLSLRYRYLGDRPANEDYSLTAEGYTLFDAVLRYARPRYELSLAAENLANVQWREAQFETESRLRGEDASVTEIHYTPGTPFFARLSCSYFF
jgi:outer membrane receptor protein involved in Fe transport